MTVCLYMKVSCSSNVLHLQGRWRGIDVAVKVLHHDSTSAAAVANEVDLVMSFRYAINRHVCNRSLPQHSRHVWLHVLGE